MRCIGNIGTSDVSSPISLDPSPQCQFADSILDPIVITVALSLRAITFDRLNIAPRRRHNLRHSFLNTFVSITTGADNKFDPNIRCNGISTSINLVWIEISKMDTELVRNRWALPTGPNRVSLRTAYVL